MDDFAALVKIVSGIGASFSTKLVKEVAQACVRSDEGDWENGRKEAAKIYEKNETACPFPELQW